MLSQSKRKRERKEEETDPEMRSVIESEWTLKVNGLSSICSRSQRKKLKLVNCKTDSVQTLQETTPPGSQSPLDGCNRSDAAEGEINELEDSNANFTKMKQKDKENSRSIRVLWDNPK